MHHDLRKCNSNRNNYIVRFIPFHHGKNILVQLTRLLYKSKTLSYQTMVAKNVDGVRPFHGSGKAA